MLNETNDTNTYEFYLDYIFFLSISYIITLIIVNILENKNEEDNKLNISLDAYALGKDHIQIFHDKLTYEQKSLRWKFLLVSTAIKACTWIKAPYTYALYNRVHGFSREDIGLLVALENFVSLLFGPFIGSICDIHGRKKFCFIYCVMIVIHIGLRVTGIKWIAYIANFIAGLCSIILDTAFESWVIFEANGLFEDNPKGEREKNSFLREIFSKQVNLDCLSSIALTAIATFLYLKYDIFYPFYTCILFAVIAGVLILILWKENDIHNFNLTNEKNQTFYEKMVFSWSHIFNNKDLLCLGSVEAFFKISLYLYLFIWTPFLEETSKSLIHPGAIFACFMLARLIGSDIYSAIKKLLNTNSYLLSIFVTFTGMMTFLLCYTSETFNTRLILFIYFDGLSGIFHPLMSTLKSQLVPEQYRTTIMNFFRVPIGIICVLSLIFTRYITTYQICLLCFFFMLISFLLNIYLLKVHIPPDSKIRILKKSSELCEIFENEKIKKLL